MTMIHQYGAVDMALLLLGYQNNDPRTSKRHLDTLHTSLLANGVFNERDYEILSVLYAKWCPNDEFVPTV